MFSNCAIARRALAWGVTAALALSTAPAASAQNSQTLSDVRYQDFAFANESGRGSKVLELRAYYPASSKAGGARAYPSVVVLHGRAQLGRDYAALAEHFARRDYFVFLLDTARWDVVRIGDDAVALFARLAQENATESSPFAGRLDMRRVGLLGHSWGGANVYRVLADNPGYRVGATFAPHAIAARHCAGTRLPVLSVVGRGDTITPAATHAMANYRAHRAGDAPLSALYELEARCNHANVARARYHGAGHEDERVFENAVTVVRSFCDHWLKADTRALGLAVGAAGRALPFFPDLHMRATRPQLFESGSALLGATGRVHLVSGAGLAYHLYSYRSARLATDFGLLRLDKNATFVPRVSLLRESGVAVHDVRIPDDRRLIGLPLHFQGLSYSGGRLRLSNALSWTLR